MRFVKGQNYKLIEIDGALVITDKVDTRVAGKGQQPLVIADAGKLLTYLDRYFYERENGAVLKDAHERALKTAQITIIIPPFKKKDDGNVT